MGFYEIANSQAIRSLGKLRTIFNKGVTVRLKDDQRQCLVAQSNRDVSAGNYSEDSGAHIFFLSPPGKDRDFPALCFVAAVLHSREGPSEEKQEIQQ